MKASQAYDKDFYTDNQSGSLSSAQEIVPLVIQLVKPKSVVDVGCGIGEFLRVFQEQGVSDIFGVDGDYVKNNVVIPKKSFRAMNLNKPFKLDRRYDLAISLEVGEHIAPESAQSFVKSLTLLAPVVLFSAAAPLQGGTLHVNEQWPDYWARLFKREGFRPVDALRRKVWDNEKVEWWYRQNALFFCTDEALANNPELAKEAAYTSKHMLSVVHPKMYLQWHKVHHPSLMDKIRKKAKKIAIIRNTYYRIKKPFGYVSAT